MQDAPPFPVPSLRLSGINPLHRAAIYLSWGQFLLWLALGLRWLTFSLFNWTPLPAELALAAWPPLAAYLIYGLLAALDLLVGLGLRRGWRHAAALGVGRNLAAAAAAVAYFLLTQEFWGACLLFALAVLGLLLLRRQTAWALAFPAAFWLALFFILPLLIVFIVSLGERARLGTVTYPPLRLDDLSVYFNDYVRFFSRINGDLIYLRIFGRSLWMALLNTFICLALGYPFAFWIARQPRRRRGALVFLVMIPFWTNFLVRTYAWMLILRDSGLINNLWTITLHEQAVMLAAHSGLFAWLAEATAQKLPLLFNLPAVMLGLCYGYLPFMILPLYSNLEKLDWSLLEAAADLGAGKWRSTTRILLPLSRPGIVAGAIIVFIPSLGAYVTPDLMGGARVALVGNLLQQQFMTVRDWPFGSAVSFILMAIMLAATIIYFRSGAARE